MNFFKGNVVYLNHPLCDKTPGFGGAQDFIREQISSISTGSSSNSERWILKNHVGTHIDCPLHFCENGQSIEQFPPAFWFFKNVCLWSKKLEPSQLLNVEDFDDNLPADMDLLLIKTGFEAYRHEKIYWEKNPGISPEVASYLRQKYIKLRAVGFDFISLSAFQHRGIGREAHKKFLCANEGESPLLILEDMKLSPLISSPLWTVVSPLIVENADGAPVTVFAANNE